MKYPKPAESDCYKKPTSLFENFEDGEDMFKHSSFSDSVKYRRTECVKVISKNSHVFILKKPSHIHVQRPAFNVIEISEVELIVQKTSGKAKTTSDFVR